MDFLNRIVDSLIGFFIVISLVWFGAAVYNPSLDSDTVWFVAFVAAVVSNFNTKEN